MKTVLIIIDYFGEWPEWFPMFLKSCEWNPTINWRFHTDCPIPSKVPANVSFSRISQVDYYRYVSYMLGIFFCPETAYNICSVRPAFGILYPDEIKNVDYFGWSDIDLIYGDIRSFYTDEVLSHNLISSAASMCTGHFTLIKNEQWLREAYRLIPQWKQRLEHPQRCLWINCLDEAGLSGLFSPADDVRKQFYTETPRETPTFGSIDKCRQNNYFKEQWVTPFCPWPWHDGNHQHPDVWYWHKGHLTNSRDGDREYLYLHLMNFKRAAFINQELYADSITWDMLPRCLHFDTENIRDRPIRIDRQGIHLVETYPDRLPEDNRPAKVNI